MRLQSSGCMMPSSIPQTETLRFYEGYVASFDSRTRNPKWVLEYITKDSLKGEGNREQSSFYEDPGLESRFKSKLGDYANSGYDRGHMVGNKIAPALVICSTWPLVAVRSVLECFQGSQDQVTSPG
eukprot:GHUV01054974.1.p1 GENE.GHUV01054974.1~~GHUV01054974.1.p1  ORF type:complete len:126 (+),score=11.38 GHUV01054974.1:190-567(+)